VTIGDAYTTGSSLMPQKKNPDICELTRGKTGRVVGNLVALLTTLKGLPLTYNSDMQEDKERLFDTVDTVRATTTILAPLLRDTAVNSKACAAAVKDPILLATDLVDWLVLEGMPFRKAHHVVGKIVAVAEAKKKRIDQLSPRELSAIDKKLTKGALSVLDLKTAMKRRRVIGAPSDVEVDRRLAYWREFLDH
jgi:argininosuccinate lyase